jgi:hypothetical protein
MGCWDSSLGNRGLVEIATSGNWHNAGLTKSITDLVDGDTAPTKLPTKPTK